MRNEFPVMSRRASGSFEAIKLKDERIFQTLVESPRFEAMEDEMIDYGFEEDSVSPLKLIGVLDFVGEPSP